MATIKSLRTILSLSILLFPTMALAEPSLEVKDLRVTFPSATQIRVQGMMRCNDLEPRNLSSPTSEIEVNIDFPDAKGEFALLPDRFVGYHISQGPMSPRYYPAESNPTYYYKGKGDQVATTKKRFFKSTQNLWPPIIDTNLLNDKDDGRWISFDKTQVFKAPGPRYRVVIGWKHSYIKDNLPGKKFGRFAHNYYWAEYGPFPWGKSPACGETLRAKYCQPVSFTEQGAKTRAAPEVDDQPEGTSNDTAPPKRKPLVRKERPSQLEAVNAGNQLEQTLAGLEGIQRAGVVVTPRSASVSIVTDENLDAKMVTPLIVKSFVEVADALSWVQSITIQAQGRTMSATWDSVAKYVAGEMTMEEFLESAS